MHGVLDACIAFQFCNNLILFIGKCMLLDETYTADQEPAGEEVKGQFTSLSPFVMYEPVSEILKYTDCKLRLLCIGNPCLVYESRA